MKICLFSIALSLSICFSCKTVNDRAIKCDGGVVYISRDSLVKGRTMNLVDSVRYIKLQTTDQCLVGKVEKIEIYASKIFVQDVNRNLYVFAETGEFVTKIGQQGRGAEEYASMAGFCLDKVNNWVGIIDVIGGKITYYDFTGKFAKKVSSNPVNFNFLMTSVQHRDVLLNFHTCFFQVIYSVQMYDAKDMELKQSLHPYPMNRTANTIWSRHPYAETAEGISFIKPLSDTIFLYDGIQVRPCYILEHDRPLATQSVCDAFNKEISQDETFFSFLNYLATNVFFQSMLKIYETRDYLFISLMADKNVISYIMWNKKMNKGIYEGEGAYGREECVFRPFLTNLISSTDDYFIAVYDDSGVDLFRGMSRIDLAMQQIVENWDEEDNPVIALFYMKKEI